MNRNRIGKKKYLFLFLFAALAVCLFGTGCCIRNAWSIGDRTETLDDRYYEYSIDKSEFIYTCLLMMPIAIVGDVLLLPYYIPVGFLTIVTGHSPI